MKKIWVLGLATVLFLSLAFSPVEAKTLLDIIKAGKMVVGTKADAPPWGVMDAQGKFQGWEIDLIHKLAEYLFGDSNKVQFVAVAGANRVPFLESEKVDIIWATMGYTPERAKRVDYSIPYSKSDSRILVKKGSPIKDLENLHGKKVITMKGTIPAQELRKLIPDMVEIQFSMLSEAMQALRDDRGVAFAQATTFLRSLALSNPGFEVVGRPYGPEWNGVCFRKGEEDIKAFVNLAIMHMWATGFLEKSMAKWFKDVELDEYINLLRESFKDISK